MSIRWWEEFVVTAKDELGMGILCVLFMMACAVFIILVETARALSVIDE